MDFSNKKLPRQAAEKLRLCPIHTVSPYALMHSPVYVYMKLNEKFVAVKGPLDFFTAEELQRLAPFESFFMPEFIDSTASARQTARAVRGLLRWEPSGTGSISGAGEESYPEVPIPPSSFEVSDAILRLVGPLWNMSDGGPTIEPFFVAVFANELCDAIPFDLLLEAREMSVTRYEDAILLSSWAVFLALHLGYCDFGFLNALRLEAFRAEAKGETKEGALAELIRAAKASIDGHARGKISTALLGKLEGRAGAKIASRMRRVQEKFVRPASDAPTIHGLKGFVDV